MHFASAAIQISIGLSEAYRVAGSSGRAKASLEKAESIFALRTPSRDLDAELCAARAHFVEADNPQLTRAFFELAIDRLDGPKQRASRIEMLLGLAGWYLRHQEPAQALACLRRAERSLGLQDEPLLRARLEAHRAAVGLGFAEVAEPLERIAHLAGALGHWERTVRVPRAIAPCVAHEQEDLRRRIQGLDMRFEARVAQVEVARVARCPTTDSTVVPRLAAIREALLAICKQFGDSDRVRELAIPTLEAIELVMVDSSSEKLIPQGVLG